MYKKIVVQDNLIILLHFYSQSGFTHVPLDIYDQSVQLM